MEPGKKPRWGQAGPSNCVCKTGCPTWIRTMNNASKGRCVTITPSDNHRTVTSSGMKVTPQLNRSLFQIQAGIIQSAKAKTQSNFKPGIGPKPITPVPTGPVPRPNPKGILSQSPGLRQRRYPGCVATIKIFQEKNNCR